MDQTRHIISRRMFLAVLGSLVAGCKIGGTATPLERPALAQTRLSLAIDFVFDRTTAITGNVAAELVDEIVNLVQPGDSVRITRFGGRQVDLVGVPIRIALGGLADPWRDSPNKVKLAKVDEKNSRAALTHALQDTLADYDSAADGSSPIFEVLSVVTDSWKQSGGQRLLLLVSDAIQNSLAVSFIAKGGATLVLPTPKWLEARLRTLRLMPANISGVPVFHIGFGNGDGAIDRRGPRSPVEVLALRRIWDEAYWKPAGAASVVFCTPLPLQGLSVRRR